MSGALWDDREVDICFFSLKKRENISLKIGFLFYFGVTLSAKMGMHISFFDELSLWY